MAHDKECSITSLLMLLLMGTQGDQQNTDASEMTGTHEETGDREEVGAGNKTDGDDNQEPVRRHSTLFPLFRCLT